MNLAWLTDIHLNFLSAEEADQILPALVQPDADAYLITGDIGEADNVAAYLRRLAVTFGRPLYFVLGNHDYYRGSIEAVRAEMFQLSLTQPDLIYLSQVGIQELTPSTCLIGHDGWPDGRNGDFETSPVLLNDFLLVRDFRRVTTDASRLDPEVKDYWLTVMQRLADEAAAVIDRLLNHALEKYQRVIVATHVPPFREATWHAGRESHDHFQPFFSSKVMGDVFLKHAELHPLKEMTVLCGHTHDGGEYLARQDLRVITGKAEYGHPEVQRILTIE